MMQAWFWCYPWDLDDEGYDAAIGKLAGEIGVDAVSVSAVTGPLSQFRARPIDARRRFDCEAGAHFQPSSSMFGGSGLRPPTASWIKSRNPLEQIARATEKRSLKLRARITCCVNSVLTARHQTIACVDLFGEAIPARMCPANPDVREYVTSLAADLASNYPVETLELDAFGFPDAWTWGDSAQIGWSPGAVERILLTWCFCSSCLQRAKDAAVDVDAVHAMVLARVQRALRLEKCEPHDLGALLAEDAALAAFDRVRREAVLSLIRTVRAKTRCRLVLHPTAAQVEFGRYGDALTDDCDGLVLPWAGGESRPLEEAVDGGSVAAAGIEVLHTCHPPATVDGPSLVAAVHQSSQAGHARIGFSNYGVAPPCCLDWVRQAIRYARRESET